jgi:hypothetical protein
MRPVSDFPKAGGCVMLFIVGVGAAAFFTWLDVLWLLGL